MKIGFGDVRAKAFMPAVLVLALAGCGGGGGANSDTSGAAAATVSGSVIKGPVVGAIVTAYAVQSGMMGGVLGTSTADAQGNFGIAIGTYAGDMVLRISGGHFTNEATGADMPMQPGDVMAAMVPGVIAGASVTGVQVTPLTSMAQAMAQRMPGGMTAANMVSANTAVGRYFMVGDILHMRAMDPLASGSGATSNADARNYGMTMGAMSQYAHDIGMQYTSGMVTAMMNDASDGCFDGMMSGTPIGMGGGMMGGTMMQPFAGTSGMANAMAQFVRSPMNRSGVTVQDMQALMNQLMTSNCTIR